MPFCIECGHPFQRTKGSKSRTCSEKCRTTRRSRQNKQSRRPPTDEERRQHNERVRVWSKSPAGVAYTSSAEYREKRRERDRNRRRNSTPEYREKERERNRRRRDYMRNYQRENRERLRDLNHRRPGIDLQTEAALLNAALNRPLTIKPEKQAKPKPHPKKRDCVVCGTTFEQDGKRIVCSDKCKLIRNTFTSKRWRKTEKGREYRFNYEKCRRRQKLKEKTCLETV